MNQVALNAVTGATFTGPDGVPLGGLRVALPLVGSRRVT
jgi:hypothetical protein